MGWDLLLQKLISAKISLDLRESTVNANSTPCCANINLDAGK